MRGGKLVVFGTGDLIANARIEQGNLAIFLNAVNWTVDRDGNSTSVPAVERFQLTLSAADFSRRYALLLMPGSACCSDCSSIGRGGPEPQRS